MKTKTKMKKFAAISTIAALMLVASPAAAFQFGGSDSDIEVKIENEAYVKNVVDTKADTGDNTSKGGSAESTAKAEAEGGDADADSDANGGDGGDINTGDAKAQAFVLNDVNNNTVSVKASCSCRRGGDIEVKVENEDTTVKNYVDTKADSGDNYSKGGSADSYAKAETEDDNNNHRRSRFSWFSHHNSNNGGDADADSDANGGDGGVVNTGDADSYSQVDNYVNTNVVRVRR